MLNVTSLRKNEQRQRKLAQLTPLPIYDRDDEVLTFADWVALNKISPRTGRRILKSPDRPIVTQLSARRIGISRGNNRRWQASRERSS
jgi:hypothetical protein